MARKRMFDMEIIDTDFFLDMPQSSQNLYFHLGMRADDDGFVSNPKKIIKIIGANDDDLKILFTKQFVIPFESGVVVIRHWKLNNYLRKDRYTETIYKAEKRLLTEDENGVYSLGIPDDNQMATNGIHSIEENSIEKKSIEENSINNNMSDAKAPDEYIIDLPTNRFNTIQECYYVTNEFYKTMIELYPNVNVLEELKKMKAWLLTNNSKRKTLKGMGKFINSWLSRQQDSYKGTTTNNKKSSGIDWEEWNEKYNQTKNNVDYEELIKKGEVF